MSRVRCCWPSCPFPRYGYLYLCQTHANTVWRYVEDEADESLREAQAKQRPAALKDHERHGWVYYLDVGGRLKIGFASDLGSRLRAYPPDTPVLARKRGTMADEKAEHQRCKPWLVAGREWYEINDSTLRVVEEAKQYERERAAAEQAASPPPPRPAPPPPIRRGTGRPRRVA